MNGRRLGAGLFAGVSASLLGLTSMINPAFAHGEDVGLVIGGSGIPVPPPSYVQPAFDLYIQPRCADCIAQALFTPEGLYPLYEPPGPAASAVKQLPFDTSVYQGRQILDSTIEQQVGAGDTGNKVWVYGESQSSTISSLAMADLAAAGVPSSDVTFVLVGDPDNPNGGLLARFPDGLTLPSLGITFYGATPDNLYPTTIYTQEYDGFADFPQYPIDLLSDLNAFFGIYYVHPTYRNLTPEQIANAIPLPGTTDTSYYMIPTQNLPLLDPLRAIPVVGNPLADLLQPDLRVLVNLGYGSITQGWSSGPANVQTTIGVFPTNISPLAVVEALAAGARQGVQAFIGDVSHLSLSSLALPSRGIVKTCGLACHAAC